MGFPPDDIRIDHICGRGKNVTIRIIHVPTGLNVMEEWVTDKEKSLMTVRNRLIRQLRDKVDAKAGENLS
jgi:protein subunit release factor A